MGALGTGGLGAQEKPPTFPSAVELVTVDVVVTDKKGNPIPALRAADFTLLEDGTPQTITSFEAVSGAEGEAEASPAPTNPRVSTNVGMPAGPGRTFVIVFDEPHLTGLQAARGKRALEGFLKGVVREGEHLRLVAVGRFEIEGVRDRLLEELPELEGRRIEDETPEALSDHEAMRITLFDDQPLILRVLERIAVLTAGRHTRLSEGERNRNTIPAELGLRLDEGHVKLLARRAYEDAVTRNRATLDSLESAIEAAATIRGRKSVVLVSEGIIKDPQLDGFRRVIDAARRANAALYFIDTRGLEGIPFESAQHGTYLASIDQGIVMANFQLNAAGAESLAADTGGFTVKNRNDLLDGFRRIAAETRSYYLLGYSPRLGKAAGKFRKIEVKVRRSGVTVRAREGYYPGSAPTVASGPAGGTISLRIAAYVGAESSPGKVQALVVADADPAALSIEEREGRFFGRLELRMVVTPKDGGEPVRFDQQVELSLSPERRRALETRWLPIVRRFDLTPGAYRAHIAVRDLGNERVGAVSHDFEVPDSPFRTSTPVLSDALEPDAARSSGVPLVGACRSFSEQSTLYFQFEVYGGAIDPAKGQPRVSSSYSVRDRDGVEWAQSGPAWMQVSAAGVAARVGEISLTFKPGDYDLVLDVKDEVTGRTIAVKEPFTVK